MWGAGTILGILLCALQAVGQLVPGDIAVIAFNSDAPDEFAWVTLKDLPAGTVLCFTDSSVSNGYFRWSEHLAPGARQFGLGGPLVWSNTVSVARGTVVRFNLATTNWSLGQLSGHHPLLSASGDQIFVYQGRIIYNAAHPKGYEGDPSDARVLFGLNFANAGWSSRGGANFSEIPFGISTESFTAVHVGPRDNGYYAGICTGTVTELRRALADTNNWITSDAYISPALWPKSFEILPQVPLIEFH
ncbi:MAG: hypothetical protein N2255_08600 [Kiritimatiellae bacterium]|nr:hypothetical protein [Kiritimatiellia bacterium]